MLLISFLVCSSGLFTNFTDLTNLFMNSFIVDLFSENATTIQTITSVFNENSQENTCFQVAYYSDSDNNCRTYPLTVDPLNDPLTVDPLTPPVSPNNPPKKDRLYLSLRTITERLEDIYINYYRIYTNNAITLNTENNVLWVIRSILLINFIIVTGFIISITIFSHTYKSMCDDFPDTIEDYVAYEDKYDRDFYELEEKQLTTKENELLKDVYIRDETPNGDIILYYDFATTSFNYYFNNKNAITYPELEAAAKLFAIKNNCRSLFIKKSDTKSSPSNTQSTISNVKPSQHDIKKPKQQSNVFASVKSYNKQSTNDNNKRSRENDSDRIERLDRVKKIGNHFKHIGKLDDFDRETKDALLEQSIIEPDKPDKPDKPDPIVKHFDDANIVIIPRSPPGKLLKKSSSKIMPKNNISFADYKRQVLEPNHKQ